MVSLPTWGPLQLWLARRVLSRRRGSEQRPLFALNLGVASEALCVCLLSFSSHHSCPTYSHTQGCFHQGQRQG